MYLKIIRIYIREKYCSSKKIQVEQGLELRFLQKSFTQLLTNAIPQDKVEKYHLLKIIQSFNFFCKLVEHWSCPSLGGEK